VHAPDGFLSAGAALATGAISLGAVSFATKKAGQELSDRQVPLAGMAAAFLFAAQMFNFPVLGGTTGHLLGGALAAILLGPSIAVLVVTVVVVVQALAFADGGLSALGYNITNLAVVPCYGGYGVFRLSRRFLPRSSGGVVAAAGLAGLGSVVLASMALSLEWLFGASAPVPFDTVFGSMVSTHLAIGVGEGFITATLVSTVLAARGDLVYGARDLSRQQRLDEVAVPIRTFLFAAGVIAVLLATALSQFASPNPDGLESVARNLGIERGNTVFASSFFADYATDGIANKNLSLAVAGLSGTALCLMVGYGLLLALKSGQRQAGHVR
jgi:cobalt/nickel transport system permease protein